VKTWLGRIFGTFLAWRLNRAKKSVTTSMIMILLGLQSWISGRMLGLLLCRLDSKRGFHVIENHEDLKTGVALSDGPVRNPDIVSIRKEQEKRRYIPKLLSHTLSRKNLLALTGLFLCFFLVIHLFGNLQLLLPEDVARWQFNFYSKLLSENILIQIISYVLFASIVAHVIYALVITVHNKRSSGKRYEYDRRSVSSNWYARKMGLLGTILLFFFIIRFRDFWYQLQFGHVSLDKDGQKDLYTLVVTVYRDGWYVLIYVLCMVALGYHLLHGSFSAARTLGFYNARYVRWVRTAAWIYSIGISAGFAIIPVYIHFARP
jgi:succinate dehydrogenase / fumarate reductase cytochrome b subunit